MWNLKYDISELIYETETSDSQTQGTDCGCQGGGREKIHIGSLGLADANYYIQNG